jgi:hypothetical protein
MDVIQCPEEVILLPSEKSLFLGGGISNCPNWQEEFVQSIMYLRNVLPLAIVNPRREDFDVSDPSMSVRQIQWEFDALNRCDWVLFWFPKETLCPITLYELGAQTKGNKKLFVGTHPLYQRALDVEVQLSLARPEIVVRHSLEELVEDVVNALKQ